MPNLLIQRALLILGLSINLTHAGEFCKPIRYADGDTFTYFDKASSASRNVRVKGYDAPERSQPFSKQTTQAKHNGSLAAVSLHYHVKPLPS